MMWEKQLRRCLKTYGIAFYVEGMEKLIPKYEKGLKSSRTLFTQLCIIHTEDSIEHFMIYAS